MNESNPIKKTLLIGIGNSGRSDDALGWKFLEIFSSFDELFDFEYRYQLQIEDADLISRYDTVIFVDASHKPVEHGVAFYPCTPSPTTSFTTHRLDPETVLWLSRDLFGVTVTGYIMAIEGSEWELRHGLSKPAEDNLHKATSIFMDHISETYLAYPTLDIPFRKFP